MSRAAALVLAVSGASALGQQTYEINATTRATGQPDDVQVVTFGDFVQSSVLGGSSDGVGSTVLEAYAEGGPRAALTTASATAETIGPNKAGGTQADLRSQLDVIDFNHTAPITVRVSMEMRRNAGTTGVGQSAEIFVVSTWSGLTTTGFPAVNQTIRFQERLSGETSDILFDERDPIDFVLQPGESLRHTSLWLRASASASASVVRPSGAANAMIEAVFSVEVIDGVGDITVSNSGAPYGPPPCSIADIVEPFGVVDLGDIDAFIAAFLVGGADADLVDPQGVVDLADIDAFIVEFLAGCP